LGSCCFLMEWTAWVRKLRLTNYEPQLRDEVEDMEDLKFINGEIAAKIAETINMKELPKRRFVEWAEQQTEPEIKLVTTSLHAWLTSCGVAHKEDGFNEMADDLDDLCELNEDDVARILQGVNSLRIRRVLAHLTALKNFTHQGSKNMSEVQEPSPPVLVDSPQLEIRQKEEEVGNKAPPFHKQYLPAVQILPEDADEPAPPPPARDYNVALLRIDENDQSTPPARDYNLPLMKNKEEEKVPPPPPDRDYVPTTTIIAEDEDMELAQPERDYVSFNNTEEVPPPPPDRDYVPTTTIIAEDEDMELAQPERDYVSFNNTEEVPPPPPDRDYVPTTTIIAENQEFPPATPERDYIPSITIDALDVEESPPPPPPMRDYQPPGIVVETETLTPCLEEYRNLLDILVFADGAPKYANLLMLREYERDYKISEADAEAEINRKGWNRKDLLQVVEYCRFLSNLGKDDGSEFRARALSKFEADNNVTEKIRQDAMVALDWTSADLLSAWIGEPASVISDHEATNTAQIAATPIEATLPQSQVVQQEIREPSLAQTVPTALPEETSEALTQQQTNHESAERHPTRRPLQRMGSSVHTGKRSVVRRFEAGAVTAAIETSRRRKLGRGTVYAARLPEVGDVAVKWLRVGDDHEDVNVATRVNEANFFREVQTLAKLVDSNVIRLLGFAHGTGTDRFLVYELCAGGSLESRLAGTQTLSWGERLLIALDAARGLFFLHAHGECKYVHGDVTPSNIMLSAPSVLPAKLAEFGLAREIDRTLTHVISPGGTEGYVCPERKRNGSLSLSGDIYAMGVTLLNLLTGQPTAIEPHRKPVDLVSWTRQVLASGLGLEAACEALADPAVRKCMNNKSVEENYQLVVRGLLGLAFKCLDDEPSLRIDSGKLQEDLNRLASSLIGHDASLYSTNEDDCTTLPVVAAGPQRLSHSIAPASPGRDSGTLRVLVASFNLGFGALTSDDLDLWLRGGRVPGSVSGATPTAEKFADIVVIGTQECFSKANPREFTNLVNAVQKHFVDVSPCAYEYVDSASSGHTRLGMRLMIFIRSDRLKIESVAKDALTAGGLFKGALSAFVVVSDAAGRRSAYVFANCHLPSGEGRVDDRNAAVLRVKQRIADLSPDGAATMFIFGDLNYRSNPALNLALAPISAASVAELAAQRNLNALYSLDELRQQLDLGGCLEGFQSPKPTFLPTSRLERRPGFHYSLSRLPSYTDRVVFASTGASLVDHSGHAKMRVNCLDYDAVGEVALSDHKPVRAAFALAPILDSFCEDSFDEHDTSFVSTEDTTSRTPPDRTLSSIPSLGHRRRFARIRDLVGAWASIGIYNAVARARTHQQQQQPTIHV